MCGPCECDASKGFNPACNKTTGECRCKDYHYQPEGVEECLECACFPLGSRGQLCDARTGQCDCKEGVIGRLCDSCAHEFAEVTEHGCQVVYEQCPKSYDEGVWWPRSRFGASVEAACPPGAEGTARRHCRPDTGGWEAPDLFNCTHREMLPLLQDLAHLQTGEIQLNSYLALKTANTLDELAGSLGRLFGADIVLYSKLLIQVLEFENQQAGLDLSHRQERDFIRQIVNIGSRILERENEVTLGQAPSLNRALFSRLMELYKRYGRTLAENLADTFTNPFEILSDNLMFGLDVIDLEGGDKAREGKIAYRVLPEASLSSSYKDKKVVSEGYVTIPKFNHYMRDPSRWDNTLINIPRSLLVNNNNNNRNSNMKPTVSYTIYNRTVASFLPSRYLPDLVARWGSYFKAVSSVLSLSIMTANVELAETVELTMPLVIVFRDVKLDKFSRSTPFCARWDATIADAEGWTRDGCETELPDLWQFTKSGIDVNCTCHRVSTYAVLSETAAEGLVVSEPLETDPMVVYSTIVSLVLLAAAALAFSLLYGLQTNSNSIHRFIVLSLFMAQLLFIVEAKFHHIIVTIDFACRAMAILLHYFWLAFFAWLLVDALHLQRMLTEMRDINHGNMKFYVAMGFGIPAVIVGLSVGVRGHQYGNLHFCWLSLYDQTNSVYSMVGPICLSLLVQVCIIFFAICAAFTLKAQIEDFGNLRGLLLLNIGLLPLATGTWTAAFFLSNEDLSWLSIVYSVATLATSVYLLLGYVAFNGRVRNGLRNRYLVCLGRKVPYGESLHAGGSSTGGGGGAGTISRSALAYRTSVKSASNRNIGISTASTTSRSTSKTNSAPYRSDYYSSSDVSKIYAGGGSSHKSTGGGGMKHPGDDFRRGGGESDSESDLDQRSLDLASSHSSDEDEPLGPINPAAVGAERGLGGYSGADYNTAVPPLHINTSSGSAGLQVKKNVFRGGASL